MNEIQINATNLSVKSRWNVEKSQTIMDHLVFDHKAHDGDNCMCGPGVIQSDIQGPVTMLEEILTSV